MELRARLCALGRTLAAVLCVTGCAVPPAEGFRAFASPASGAVDVVTGLPTCVGLGGQGAAGIAMDGTRLFVSDFCTGQLFRFRPDGTPDGVTADGVTGALALTADGTLYGLGKGGLYRFDTTTLKRTGPIVGEPENCTFQGLTATLVIAATCGLFEVIGTPPVPLRRDTGVELGAVTTTPDGNVWAIDTGHGRLLQYGVTGPAVAAVPIHDGPRGVAPGCPRTPGNLFVNEAGGTLEMITGGSTRTVASGGLYGAGLTCGADGNLYVTQADRVQRIVFGGTPSGSPARDDRPVRPLVAALVLLAATIGVLRVRR